MNLKLKRLHPDAVLPRRANPTDSGLDLCAVGDVVLLPGVPTLVRTGWAVELPVTGLWDHFDNKNGKRLGIMPVTFEAQVRPRSGLALKHGITVVNSPGTVDNSYRGEIGVILRWDGQAPNVAAHKDGRRLYKKNFDNMQQNMELALDGFVTGYGIRKGDRIAQLVIAPVLLLEAEEVEDLGATERGEGGFGSTGK